MTLPDGVTIKQEGTAEVVTQRGYWTPPYKSCMLASLCSVLEWMGYDLPLGRTMDTVPPDNFVHALHVASGKFNHPTNTADTQQALVTLFGTEDLPNVKYGLVSDEALMTMLAGNFVVRVTMKMGDMPRHLRRWAGYNFKGGHAMAILDAKQDDQGKWLVFLSDPMGRPSKYSGEWVNYDTIKGALTRTNGQVQITVGEKDAAIPPPPVVEPPTGEPMIVRGRRDQYVPVKKGTPFFRPDTLEQVTKAGVDSDFRVVGYSEDNRYTALSVRTLKFPGGLAVLFAESAAIGTPYIRLPTDV